MKFTSFLLILAFLFFYIKSNNLRSLDDRINNKRKQSYEACIRLTQKAPHLNLSCENLLYDNIETNEESEKKIKLRGAEIKTLLIDESEIRKVNKIEEIKLRNLIQKLSKNNQNKKD